MNNNEIKLPFIVPKYQTYPMSTAINGIIEGNGMNKEWIYNNYILLWYDTGAYDPNYVLDFKVETENNRMIKTPLLDITCENIGKNEKLAEDIRKAIENNKYVLTMIDTFFVDEWWRNKNEKTHFGHECIIVGYNDADKYFLVADFFEEIYSIKRIKYNIFLEAWYSYAGFINCNVNEEGSNVKCFKFNNFKYEVDIKKIKAMVADFVNSTDNTIYSYQNYDRADDYVYGIKCFVFLMKEFRQKIKSKKAVSHKSIQVIYLLNDIMSQRITYMLNEKIIDDYGIQLEFEELATEAKKLKYLVIKYNYTLKEVTGKHIMNNCSAYMSKRNLLLENFMIYWI